MAVAFKAIDTIWLDPDGTPHVQAVGPSMSTLLCLNEQQLSVDLAHLHLNAIAPTNEFDGVASPGEYCLDKSVDQLYVNTGTLATNDWVLIGELVV